MSSGSTVPQGFEKGSAEQTMCPGMIVGTLGRHSLWPAGSGAPGVRVGSGMENGRPPWTVIPEPVWPTDGTEPAEVPVTVVGGADGEEGGGALGSTTMLWPGC